MPNMIQRIIFGIATLVWRCLLGLAPTYLKNLCCLTLDTRGRNSLCSMDPNQWLLNSANLRIDPVRMWTRHVESAYLRFGVRLPVP